ncbi:BTAD domain-containing putative transcriptional regulator [Streptomyces sp. NPDC048751]|uniref:AfsR/SARP family transcriptional regulator n=1 Tax=Streptomyces sp. NPDC048751 TaxID=3365591 RepID=UPI00371B7078
MRKPSRSAFAARTDSVPGASQRARRRSSWAPAPYAPRPRKASRTPISTARVELGRSYEYVHELVRLAAAHPLRETLAELPMLALCRTGRPTDALLTYEAMRRWLAQAMGADLGPALRSLHQRILRQNPGVRPRPHRARRISAGLPEGSSGDDAGWHDLASGAMADGEVAQLPQGVTDLESCDLCGCRTPSDRTRGGTGGLGAPRVRGRYPGWRAAEYRLRCSYGSWAVVRKSRTRWPAWMRNSSK